MDKEWLFEENARLENLLIDLDKQRKILKLEREMLDGEKRVFEQQKKVLEIGFKKLAADKEMFKAEKKKNSNAQKKIVDSSDRMQFRGPGFFSGITGYGSLKKRYKDLMKIYHPDNKNGDSFAVACITKEYELLKDKYKN